MKVLVNKQKLIELCKKRGWDNLEFSNPIMSESLIKMGWGQLKDEFELVLEEEADGTLEGYDKEDGNYHNVINTNWYIPESVFTIIDELP